MMVPRRAQWMPWHVFSVNMAGMKRDMKKINEVFIKYQDQMKNFAEIAVRDAKGRKDSTFFLNMASIALNGDDQ